MKNLCGATRGLALSLALTGTAIASDQAGKVTNVSIRASDGIMMANLDGVRSAAPACATRTYWAIKDESSSAGKSQFAALLAARIAGATVTLVGTGLCTRWPDAEDINWVYVRD